MKGGKKERRKKIFFEKGHFLKKKIWRSLEEQATQARD